MLYLDKWIHQRMLGNSLLRSALVLMVWANCPMVVTDVMFPRVVAACDTTPATHVTLRSADSLLAEESP
jgi:hypothetical protein